MDFHENDWIRLQDTNNLRLKLKRGQISFNKNKFLTLMLEVEKLDTSENND